MEVVKILIALPSNRGYEAYLAPLSSEGYDLNIVPTGMDAIIRMNLDVFDCLLLELNLPDLTGVEVCRIVRTEAKYSDIPILIMTRADNDDWEKAEEAFEAGAFDFIRLPSHPVELKARVSTMVHIKRLQDKLKEHAAELAKLAHFDFLTGLYNRRAFDEKLKDELARFHRYNVDLTLLISDVDHFKMINDRYGHAIGDVVLQTVASTFKKRCREVDIVGRYGGEEFVVLLPHTNQEQALILANDLRQIVESIDFSEHGINHPVTISIGLCSLQPSDKVEKEEFVKLADAALYRAKELGRNRVEVSPYVLTSNLHSTKLEE